MLSFCHYYFSETENEKYIFCQWEEKDDFFISTRAARTVEKRIKTNNLVMVLGHSGSGKSAIIQHIALQYRRQGWIIKPVYSFQEIYDVYKSEKFEKDRFIFVFNDPIGKESYDELSYNEWGRYREILDLLIERSKLLLTCRRSIFSDPRAKGFFEQELEKDDNYEQKLINIDINEDHCKLSTDEKKEMFKTHIPDAKPTKEDFIQICEIDMYFPLLCKLCRGQLMKKGNIANVFKEPVEVLKKEIVNYKKNDRETYCGLVCLILSKNDLSLYCLQENTTLFKKILELCDLPPHTSASCIIKKLEPLCGFFVKQIGDRYSFYHDLIMEVTTYVFGTDHPEETIEFADVRFLQKRISVDKKKKEKQDSFTIFLEDKHISNLVNRLIPELLGDNFIEVILNPCLRNKHVIRCFIQQLKDHEMLESIIKPQKMKTKKQEFQHLMNESWYTRLEFVSSVIECSTLFALITFCHDDLSKFCLNLLEKRETGLWTRLSKSLSNRFKKRKRYLKKKSLFAAMCANGSRDFLEMFTNDKIRKYKNIKWNNMYPIHIISVFHNHHILDCVINQDTNLDIFTTDKNPMTPLMLASGNNTQEIGYTAKDMALRRDETVYILLRRGANINLSNNNGICALYQASRNGHDSTVQLLLRNGADVNMSTKNGRSSLHVACLNGHESTANSLLNNGAKVNIRLHTGASPLHIACQKGHEKIAELLLNKDANVNLCDKNGRSSLFMACSKGHDSIANLLLKSRANVNVCDQDGASSLYIACRNGNKSTAELLLKNGAEVNLCTKKEASALYIACQNGHENIAQLLIRKGAMVNKCQEEGDSPLYTACQCGHVSITELLLNNGADVNLSSNKGTSPLGIAFRNGHDSIAQILRKNGANLSLIEQEVASVLYITCQKGNENVTKLVLDFGANMFHWI